MLKLSSVGVELRAFSYECCIHTLQNIEQWQYNICISVLDVHRHARFKGVLFDEQVVCLENAPHFTLAFDRRWNHFDHYTAKNQSSVSFVWVILKKIRGIPWFPLLIKTRVFFKHLFKDTVIKKLCPLQHFWADMR